MTHARSANAALGFRQFEAQWTQMSSRWLPVEASDSPWRFSHAAAPALPPQGWKLHVSATILSAAAVLDAVAPVLHRRAAFFKAPKSLLELRKLNCGLFYGFSQVGKFLTVYPSSDDEGCGLARELDAATRRFEAPAIPFELPIADGSSVFTRYGLFTSHGEGMLSLIRAPNGE